MKFSLILILSLNTLAISPVIKSRLQNYRDPFKRNVYRSTNKDQKRKELKTYFSNRINPQNIPIENIKITGVFLGQERRALGVDSTADAQSQEPFIIKEGMKLGPDAIEVKAILPGGIVLVEKILNVYDEEEYLETIIPVSE
ncbi:hypothetical protein [Bacteriovorax sp. Seq25_V]|uniref:hypothetical protein n=1 Tax=Bacteriovorax sp. Seq25_V TaxID=1201288 RepID=UPI000389D9FF|nr:hypothetical protein [Bacteriovorax sp. Seq25_V]EQC43514.1 hypothetical protein M900_0199 [Bacteriovorax sp. Seq25_V]